MFAEVVAGELSRQVLTRQVTSPEEFLWAVDVTMKQQSGGFDRPQISVAQFDAIHGLLASEWRRWRELPSNGTLELTFTCGRRSECPAPTVDERRKGTLASR